MVLNHYAITPDMPGSTRHFDFAREPVRRGYHVTIFASSFHHHVHKETRLKPTKKWKLEEVDGINFLWVRTFPYQRNDWCRVRNIVSFMFRAWQLGKKIPKLTPELGKPDLVIGSSVHLLAVLAAYWVAKSHRARFVTEVRGLSEFRKTRLVGWVPHPKVWEYLEEADIGLMCLHPVGDYTYGLPVKLFEYIATGMPVIASNFPLWKNFFKEHGCGITVNPLNAKEIAKAIEYLLDHPEARQKMGGGQY